MSDLLERLNSALAGRYAIERELGAGGMATVYLANDLRHHRRVAIKILHPDLAAAVGAERFIREIEIVAGLSHPHILSLYDSGEADGFLYYVMPYVDGESLRDRLTRERQLPLDDALQIIRQVGDALDFAHSRDVVHRDIKPENILLEAGHAVVADFGMARAITMAGGRQVTATGLTVGTPGYMSPEQSTGEDRIDGRSDLYSLACVLYEMLAGEPPYTGPTPHAVFAKRLSQPVPNVSTLRETVPEGVEQAITRGLAKSPADRFSTAAEFIGALTTPAEPRAAPERRRKLRRAAVVGLVVVVAVGGLTTVLVRGTLLPAGADAVDMSHLAVLPCADRMGDPEQEYIPAGVHDEVVNGLGRITAFEVRGRTSVMRYRDTAMAPPEIAGELGVGGLVECSVFRVNDDSVRVTASLLNGPRDRQLWSQEYRRAAADVFLLGRDVALGVAEALQANLTPTESALVEEQPTENQEALAHYHRGRQSTSGWTEEGIREGIVDFEHAIALDSTFALAYTELAAAIMQLGDLGGGAADMRPVDYMPRAREAVRRAIELDSDLSAAHGTLSWIRWIFDYDYDAAEREARLAVELDSTSAGAWHAYGTAHSVRGRDEEAVGALQRAIELDPMDPMLHSEVSLILNMAGRYRDALEAANTAIELDPDLFPAYANAGDAALLLGDHDEAIRLHEHSYEHAEGSPIALALLGAAYAHVGNRDEALRILDQLRELSSRQYVAPRVFSAVYLTLDSLDAAIEGYIRSAETRDPGVNLYDIRSPFTDRLRDHPRYPELMRLMRLEP
jgi:serine/threonine-protein kinase